MVLFEYFTVLINNCVKASVPQDLNSLLPFFTNSYLQPQNCNWQVYVLLRGRPLKWPNDGKAGIHALGVEQRVWRRARRESGARLARSVVVLPSEMKHLGVCGCFAQSCCFLGSSVGLLQICPFWCFILQYLCDPSAWHVQTHLCAKQGRPGFY